jgi:hypothetical protein
MLKRLSTLPTAASARLATMWREFFPAANPLKGERGDRQASDDAMKRMYATMWLDTERRAMVQTMREMDRKDGRVKQIHNRLARDCIRGGLVLQVSEKSSSETLKREWRALQGRLQLDMTEKLKSDARGFVMEGNLPLQLVLGDSQDVVAAIRMPSETLLPITDQGGRFKNPSAAWEQRDVMTGTTLATWAAWQMSVARLDPDNFDDMGSMGRPFLDACAHVWRKLVMTEEDLVLRRRMRAPLRMAHVLEGADEPTLEAYRQRVEGEKGDITTDFYLNRRGGVTAVQGDASPEASTPLQACCAAAHAGPVCRPAAALAVAGSTTITAVGMGWWAKTDAGLRASGPTCSTNGCSPSCSIRSSRPNAWRTSLPRHRIYTANAPKPAKSAAPCSFLSYAGQKSRAATCTASLSCTAKMHPTWET